MNILCVVIESTWVAVIDVEAANCCGASNRKSGTPSPPLAGVRVTRAPFQRIVLGEVSRRSPLGLGQRNPQTTLLSA